MKRKQFLKSIIVTAGVASVMPMPVLRALNAPSSPSNKFFVSLVDFKKTHPVWPDYAQWHTGEVFNGVERIRMNFVTYVPFDEDPNLYYLIREMNELSMKDTLRDISSAEAESIRRMEYMATHKPILTDQQRAYAIKFPKE